MILSFRLSMPTNNAWNGKWTGEGRFYARTRSFSKSRESKARQIMDKDFFYDFGDGWTARVDVMRVDAKEAAAIRRKTAGFCGCDWMIDSIIDHEEIKP